MTALRPQPAPRETGSAATDYWPGTTDTDDGLLRTHLSATLAEIGTTGHSVPGAIARDAGDGQVVQVSELTSRGSCPR